MPRAAEIVTTELVEKGVSLGDVSKALGLESIKTTEKHY